MYKPTNTWQKWVNRVYIQLIRDVIFAYSHKIELANILLSIYNTMFEMLA